MLINEYSWTILAHREIRRPKDCRCPTRFEGKQGLFPSTGLEHAVEGIRRASRGGLAARTVSLKAGAALLRVPNSPQVQGGCRGVPGGRTAKNVVLTQIRHGARFGCRNCERNTLPRP